MLTKGRYRQSCGLMWRNLKVTVLPFHLLDEFGGPNFETWVSENGSFFTDLARLFGVQKNMKVWMCTFFCEKQCMDQTSMCFPTCFCGIGFSHTEQYM